MSLTIAMGAWVRANTMLQDSGPHNERVADAGQVGCIVNKEDRVSDGGPETVYEIHFYPSNITAYFTSAEIEADVQLLKSDDPSLPTDAQLAAMTAISAIFEDGEVDVANETVRFSGDTQARIKTLLADETAIDAEAAEIYASEANEQNGVVTMTFAGADRLAEHAGLTDRFTTNYALSHARAL